MVRRSEAEVRCWRGASGALLSDKIGIDAREGWWGGRLVARYVRNRGCEER